MDEGETEGDSRIVGADAFGVAVIVGAEEAAIVGVAADGAGAGDCLGGLEQPLRTSPTHSITRSPTGQILRVLKVPGLGTQGAGVVVSVD